MSGPYEITVSEDEYLIREPQSEFKHEYRQGKMVAMSGASATHVRLVGNLHFAVRSKLAGKPCETFMNDLRVKVAAAHFYTYPDLTVVCGAARWDTKNAHTLVNPTCIFEVWSPSTETYDCGEKFGYYKKLESLQTYVLVSQDKVTVELFTRDAGAWNVHVFRSLEDSVPLESIGCVVPVREIYERIEFPE